VSVTVLEKPVPAPAAQGAGRTRLVAADIGFGFTKAVGASGLRSCFPSVTAPDGADALGLGEALGGRAIGHKVSVRLPDGRREAFLVGEAAQESFMAASFLGAEKPAPLHDALLLAAAYLVGGGGEGPLPGQTALAVGLPLAFYRAQRAALAERLTRLGAWVSVDGGPERWFSFQPVAVFPQGAGVVFAQEDLPRRSYAGVVDVGEYTCDYLVVDLETSRPVVEASGSVEAGCHLVAQRVAQAYLAKTGRPLPPRLTRRVLRDAAEAGRTVFRGREIDLAEEYRAAVRDAAEAVSRHVLSAWRDLADSLELTLLAGGGALLLGEVLARAFPNAQVVDDPVFANAKGYLKALSRMIPV